MTDSAIFVEHRVLFNLCTATSEMQAGIFGISPQILRLFWSLDPGMRTKWARRQAMVHLRTKLGLRWVKPNRRKTRRPGSNL